MQQSVSRYVTSGSGSRRPVAGHDTVEPSPNDQPIAVTVAAVNPYISSHSYSARSNHLLVSRRKVRTAPSASIWPSAPTWHPPTAPRTRTSSVPSAPSATLADRARLRAARNLARMEEDRAEGTDDGDIPEGSSIRVHRVPQQTGLRRSHGALFPACAEHRPPSGPLSQASSSPRSTHPCDPETLTQHYSRIGQRPESGRSRGLRSWLPSAPDRR